MASLSVTMSQFRPGGLPPAVHTGMIATGGHLLVASSGGQKTTFCPSGIALICPLPHGATVCDYMGSLATGGAAQTLKIGTNTTRSCLMSIMTVCQTFSFSASISLDVLTQITEGPHDQKWFRAPGGTRGTLKNLLPARCSLSDDAQPATTWVTGKFGVEFSASGVFTFTLFYTMDGLTGRTTFR